MSVSFDKMVESFRLFITNPIILAALVSWFLSQFIKGLIVLFNVRNKGFREVIETLLWRTGGMPSSHAAVVTSMTGVVGIVEGIESNLFAVSLIIALVVMRDAMGVRRAVGLQAKALNFLGNKTMEKNGIDFHPLKEIRGHAPMEVVAGAVLGLIVSAAFLR